MRQQREAAKAQTADESGKKAEGTGTRKRDSAAGTSLLLASRLRGSKSRAHRAIQTAV